MNKNTAKVLQGFLRLSQAEQNEFIENLNDYLRRPQYRQFELSEQIRRDAGVTFGPLNEPCPCCGK